MKMFGMTGDTVSKYQGDITWGQAGFLQTHS